MKEFKKMMEVLESEFPLEDVLRKIFLTKNTKMPQMQIAIYFLAELHRIADSLEILAKGKKK